MDYETYQLLARKTINRNFTYDYSTNRTPTWPGQSALLQVSTEKGLGAQAGDMSAIIPVAPPFPDPPAAPELMVLQARPPPP